MLFHTGRIQTENTARNIAQVQREHMPGMIVSLYAAALA